jgi:hypothetical protein
MRCRFFDKCQSPGYIGVLVVISSALLVSSGYCATTLNVVARPDAAEVFVGAGRITVNYEIPLMYLGAQTDGGGPINDGSSLKVIVMAANQTLAEQEINYPLSAASGPSGSAPLVGTFIFYNPVPQTVSISGSGTYTYILQQRVQGLYQSFREWMVLPGQTTISGGETPPSLSQTAVRGQSSRDSTLSADSSIHAVIISGLSDPAKVIASPNVTLTGGVIALGKSPTPAATPSIWSPGLRIIPDYALLTGEKIPPVTPNILDVRIVRQEVTADFPSPNPQPSN